MKKVLSIYLIFFLIQGCRKADDLPFSKPNQSVSGESIFELRPDVLQELSIFIFRRDLNGPQWNEIMSDVRQLNVNKIQMSRLTNGSPESEKKLDQLAQENIQIILNLYEDKLVYLLSWSSVENCRFSKQKADLYHFKCEPQYDIFGPNPLDGGNVLVDETVSLVRRAVPGAVESEPFFKFGVNLFNNNFVENSVRLDIFFRLNDPNTFFGEVWLSDKTVFLKDGQKLNPYPYGVFQGLW